MDSARLKPCSPSSVRSPDRPVACLGDHRVPERRVADIASAAHERLGEQVRKRLVNALELRAQSTKPRKRHGAVSTRGQREHRAGLSENLVGCTYR